MKKMKFQILILLCVLILLQFNSCVEVSNSNKVYSFHGKYICISLNQFLTELSKNIVDKSGIPEDLDSLFGMSWLEGYVIDQENKDIILVGKCLKNKPVYRVEDLIVNLQNALDSVSAPYCSLDPNPVNILKFQALINQGKREDFIKNIETYKDKVGGQKVVVGGVPSYSRHAAIMIYADYDMKRISQGLLKVNGIRSGLEIATAEKSIFDIKNSSTMSRYWLHIKKNGLVNSYPNFSYNDGIVLINECPVVVLTEKQNIDEEGKLKDADLFEDVKNAQIFADEMSENYDTLAEQNKLFAELENLFRLQACFRALKYKNEEDNSGTDLAAVKNIRLSSGNELPDSLPGLMNYKIEKEEIINGEYREISSQIYFIAGGVSQELKIKEKNLSLNDGLAKVNTLILESRPEKKASHWELKVPEPQENKFLKFFEIKN